jgi:hypothetical protein
MEPSADVKQSPSLASVVSLVIIVVVVCVGALYLWGSTLSVDDLIDTPVTEPATPANNEPETPRAKADVETLGAMSTSDELGAISADLDSTHVDLDSDVQAMEAEVTALEGESE